MLTAASVLLAITLVLAPIAAASAQSVMLESSMRVHISGQVKHPGIYRLYLGARQADAIQAAGGIMPGAELEILNLAASLQDGDTLTVPARGAALPGAIAPVPLPAMARNRAPVRVPPRQALLDLNLASLSQLDSLPGVGPSLAGDIISYRNAHGRFHSLDELREIAGIGDRRLARLKPLLRI